MKDKCKILLLCFFVAAFTGCVSTKPNTTIYTLNGVTAAAGKLMPVGGPDEFHLYNLPFPGGKPEDLLTLFRQAKEANACLAIGSPKLEYIVELVDQVLELAGDERFDGLYLIIIADRVEQTHMNALLQKRGVTTKYGIFD